MERFCIFLVLFVNFYLYSAVARNPSASKRVEKRSATDGDSILPNLNEQLQGNTNLQSAYFLGQCLMCPPGPTGATGPRGPQGISGRDGRDAILVQTIGSNSDDTSSPSEPQNNPNVGSQVGQTYTRWGRKSCPLNSVMIYEGVMAGSHYTHAGGAANYLCLTKSPLFDHPQAGNQYGTYIYGTEYETGSSPLLPDLQDFEVPCAVCLAPVKSLILMVPGRNECPQGPEERNWTLEYQGYIMSQHHSHPRTMFVCVDSEAEGIPRTHGDHNGALLYHVETQCATGGGIPCPPYVTGYELTCAVCSL